ncbi:MAG: hypothetical protein ABJF11_17275 [Reichenbachiella sp.]|uniref:hypothetical protein n=1 Tax=Reichenbachiella sp. TaxID=2184521 RepID=UPI003266589A
MSDTVSSCRTLIIKHFQLPEEELANSGSSIEELEQSLARIIQYLIDQDMPRLMNAFYKIDLDENVFKRILTTEPTDQMCKSLARAVIKRELQKIETREKYKDN